MKKSDVDPSEKGFESFYRFYPHPVVIFPIGCRPVLYLQPHIPSGGRLCGLVPHDVVIIRQVVHAPVRIHHEPASDVNAKVAGHVLCKLRLQ